MALCEPGLLLHIEIMMHGLSKISPEFGNVPILVARPGVGRGALQHRVVPIHFLFRVRLVVLRDKTVLKKTQKSKSFRGFLQDFTYVSFAYIQNKAQMQIGVLVTKSSVD